MHIIILKFPPYPLYINHNFSEELFINVSLGRAR